MVRHSRRNRKGGDKLDDIQSQLNTIQQQVNEIKSNPSSSKQESSDDFYGLESSMSKPEENTSSSSSSDFMSDYANEPSVAKPWQDNKDIKFADGNRGRVTLSFPRIMMLLDKNIKTGNSTKNWSSIKNQLLAAATTDEVKNIIKTSGINFSGNSVFGGTKKKRKVSRKKSKRRH
jgi:hypothetical protein